MLEAFKGFRFASTLAVRLFSCFKVTDEAVRVFDCLLPSGLAVKVFGSYFSL